MDNGKFLEICKKEVTKYANDHLDKTDNKQITEDDVYVVWSCKTPVSYTHLREATRCSFPDEGWCQSLDCRRGWLC